jgi:hypothetical protein
MVSEDGESVRRGRGRPPAKEWIASDDALLNTIGQPDVHSTAGWVDIGSGTQGFWTEDELKRRADICWLVQGGNTLIYMSGPGISLDRLTSLATKVEADFA